MILIIVFQDLPVERMFDFQDFPGSNFQDFPETGQNRFTKKDFKKGGISGLFKKGKKFRSKSEKNPVENLKK